MVIKLKNPNRLAITAVFNVDVDDHYVRLISVESPDLTTIDCTFRVSGRQDEIAGLKPTSDYFAFDWSVDEADVNLYLQDENGTPIPASDDTMETRDAPIL